MDLEHLAPELVTKINCTYSNEAATKLVVAALESVQSETRRLTLEQAAELMAHHNEDEDAIMPEAVLRIRRLSRKLRANAIRALIAEPVPPDPLLVALAGLFAAWWTQIASAEAAAVQRGLAVRGSVLTLELTSLGKAAIAFAEAGR